MLFAWIQETSIENNNKYDFTGKFIKQYEIPLKWIERNPKLQYSRNEYEAVETTSGVFLTDYGEFLEDIEDGQEIAFNVIRFDLVCWLEL